MFFEIARDLIWRLPVHQGRNEVRVHTLVLHQRRNHRHDVRSLRPAVAEHKNIFVHSY